MLNEEVLDWLKEQGLNPWNFNCENQEECSAGIPDSKFATIRPPMLGERYLEGTLPRLLVISVDANSPSPLPDNEGIEPMGPDPKAETHPKNGHWYRTYQLVLAIQQQFDPDLELTDARTCFAHARAIKCCRLDKDDKCDATTTMFNNCHAFVPNQVSVFRPDIVLTQGNKARDALASGDHSEMQSKTYCGSDDHHCRYRVLDLELNRPTLWIHTYHPTSRPNYYPNFKDGYFSCYPLLAKKFMNDQSFQTEFDLPG